MSSPPFDYDIILKHYKILIAMIALGEFSVDELAEICDIQIDIVHSMLIPRKHLLEPIEDNSNDRFENRIERFRINPTQLEYLDEEIDVLYNRIKSSKSGYKLSKKPEIPVSLLIAEDILFCRMLKDSNAGNNEKLLELAVLNFEIAKSEWENLINGDGPEFDFVNKRLKTVSKSIDDKRYRVK